MRIPRKIFLPWGWEIEVKQVSSKTMADKYGVDETQGLWDVDDKMIYILKSLSLVEKVDTLGHELDHALNDWRSEVTQRAGIRQQSQKARARLKARKR